MAAAVAAGMIGHESDTHSRKLFKAIALEHVNARQNLWCGDVAHRGHCQSLLTRSCKASQVAVQSFVVLRQLVSCARNHCFIRHGAGGNGGHSATQGTNVALTIRMHTIAEEDDEHPTGGIDPKRRAGETCVAERAERKKIAAVG